ncbi:MAG TPA: HNH endonuclease signature motif containing protein, partial [Streptosporangiaceae bacterium]|nr:HNH endonuclease signature motif containing protein [Streptosporangiaceae bacterium]
RGCSFPGCPVPAHLCQTHHCNPYATDPVTDINDLTLACGPNHKLAEQGWTTRKNARGDTEWIPPPHLDRGSPGSTPSTTPRSLSRMTTRRPNQLTE